MKESIPAGVFKLSGLGDPKLEIIDLLSQTLVLADAQ
jgi:hypothetical protein